MSSPHQPNARSFARRVSEPLAVSHLSIEPSAHRRLTDKHNDANTTQEFKIRAVEEKALLPGKTLVTEQ